MIGLFRMTLKRNIRVLLVPSKSISATNRTFGIAFVRSFYLIRVLSKAIATFAINIFLIPIMIFPITIKGMRKAIRTGNSKIFKNIMIIFIHSNSSFPKENVLISF